MTTYVRRRVLRGNTLIALTLACGDTQATVTSITATTTTTETTASEGSNSISSTSTAPTSTGVLTEEISSGSTASIEPCSLVHVGDLVIGSSDDFDALKNLGEVTGDLTIFFLDPAHTDLSFLPCLRRVRSLTVEANDHLETTEGLISLRESASFRIEQNPKLRTIAGFDQIESTTVLRIVGNPLLEEIRFESLRSAENIVIGMCENTMPAAQHFALTNLAGFGALEELNRFTVSGNEALASIDLLDALILNGAPPLGFAEVRHNPLLLEASVHAKLDLQGAKGRDVCGNKEGAVECFCVVG